MLIRDKLFFDMFCNSLLFPETVIVANNWRTTNRVADEYGNKNKTYIHNCSIRVTLSSPVNFKS